MARARLAALSILLASPFITGCTKSNTDASSTAQASSSAMAPAAASPAAVAIAGAPGDAAHGKVIFASNCASCHGATGGGGGTLKGEKTRRTEAAAIAWIKNPQPPMPKLYPSPLSEKDVSDVAAYVESL